MAGVAIKVPGGQRLSDTWDTLTPAGGFGTQLTPLPSAAARGLSLYLWNQRRGVSNFLFDDTPILAYTALSQQHHPIHAEPAAPGTNRTLTACCTSYRPQDQGNSFPDRGRVWHRTTCFTEVPDLLFAKSPYFSLSGYLLDFEQVLREPRRFWYHGQGGSTGRAEDLPDLVS